MIFSVPFFCTYIFIPTVIFICFLFDNSLSITCSSQNYFLRFSIYQDLHPKEDFCFYENFCFNENVCFNENLCFEENLCVNEDSFDNIQQYVMEWSP